jgi:immunoglobulin-binding protein 1
MPSVEYLIFRIPYMRIIVPMMTEPESNIRTLFTRAKQLKKELNSLESNTQLYQENLQAAISALDECRKLADRVSLFSPNETIDDISSGDIQYLSIDYILGDLITRKAASDRKSLLRDSQEAYDRYLHLLDTYSLLSGPDKKLYERYIDQKDAFALLSSSDPSIRRETKITRFKQEKDLKQKLEACTSPSILLNFRTDHTLSICRRTQTLSKMTIPPSDPYTLPNSRFTPTKPSMRLTL